MDRKQSMCHSYRVLYGKEQKELLEEDTKINICGGIPVGQAYIQYALGAAGGKDFTVMHSEETLESTLSKLDKPFVNVGTEGHIEYNKPVTQAGDFDCTGFKASLFEFDTLNDILYEEDETISCKDKASGVKCKKIKQGKHFKPFYQTGRY